MRQEGNSLDLNNLPEEYGKQAIEENSTTTATSAENTRIIKKKKSGKEGKEDGENVYECRFCSLKFCKSQALGGHMNRHRQERETETLNRARQLVFSNDGFAGIGSQMGLRDISFGGGSGGQSMTPAGCFPHGAGIGDACLQFRPVYPLLPTRPAPSTNPLQPYMYAASSSRPLSYTDSSYPPTPAAAALAGGGEYYYMGRVLGGEAQTQAQNPSTPVEPNHARLGTTMEGQRPPAPGNWRCIFGYGGQHNSDASSTRGPF